MCIWDLLASFVDSWRKCNVLLNEPPEGDIGLFSSLMLHCVHLPLPDCAGLLQWKQRYNVLPKHLVANQTDEKKGFLRWPTAARTRRQFVSIMDHIGLDGTRVQYNEESLRERAPPSNAKHRFPCCLRWLIRDKKG
ncbi:unnamed protein product [Pleuronectes platessa]|uniref:Uncharacterized protein n=1 Tax=Pleuronectes platessa TaxID=8262 RepID=A0A9N7UXE9_PLEPL|nr:unnamed protein product [Pleuronectes platessa]